MKRYPMAHKIVIAQPYHASFDTDIRKTIKTERKRLAEANACKVVSVPALIADTVAAVPTGRHVLSLHRGRK